MDFDYKSLVNKVLDEQQKKIAEEQERLRKQKEDEERRLAEERARQEELERQERIEEERKRQEQLAKEARERAEEEERRRQEAQRQERERMERTQRFVSDMALLYPRMQDLDKKGRKANVFEIDNLLNEFINLKNQNVDCFQSTVYSDACRIYNNLLNSKNKILEHEKKIKKVHKTLGLVSLLLATIVLITGGVIGIKKYHETDAYITKQEEKEQLKQKKIAEKKHQKLLKSYKVGGFGEAGIIFYDKGDYSDGWRFLEVATKKFPDAYFSSQTGLIDGLKTELGTGDINTQLIIQEYGYDTAAAKAASYKGGDKTDWYLGNKAEMILCYNTLVDKTSNVNKLDKYVKEAKLDKFYTTYWADFNKEAICYICSEQATENKAYSVIFSTSKLILHGGEAKTVGNTWTGFKNDDYDSYNNYIRPIRKF